MKRKRFAKHVYLAILHQQRMICACGCGEKMSNVEGIDFDHDRALWDMGEDAPENLHAWRRPCHKKKTAREAGRRAKLERIVLKGGLKTRGKNAKERALERTQRWRDMP